MAVFCPSDGEPRTLRLAEHDPHKQKINQHRSVCEPSRFQPEAQNGSKETLKNNQPCFKAD